MRIFNDQEIKDLRELLFGEELTLADLLVVGDLIKGKYKAEVEPFNLFKKSEHHPLQDYCTELNQALGALIFSTNCYGKTGSDYEITKDGFALSIRYLIMKREGLEAIPNSLPLAPNFMLAIEGKNIQYFVVRTKYSDLLSDLRMLDLPNVTWRSGIEANLPSPEEPQAVVAEQILLGASLECLCFDIRRVVYDPHTNEVKEIEYFESSF